MRRTRILIFSSVLLLLAALGLGYNNVLTNTVKAQETNYVQSRAMLEDENNTVNVVEDYGPSVVAIHVVVKGERVMPGFGGQLPPDMFEYLPPEFRRFFEMPGAPQQPQEYKQQGSGSGFVVTNKSEIITNYHVVEAALEKGTAKQLEGATITVLFPDNDNELKAHVVGASALYDLALLKLDNPNMAPNIRPIPISNSDELKVGQKTIAIGNPFGFASTVTTGIVSGIDRSLDGIGENNVPLIQTDAAINPGNSGGPLLNSRGELIGINTAIIPGLSVGGERGNIGIGFAVPSNLLSESLSELRKGGLVSLATKPRLGISVNNVDVYDDLKDELNLNLPEDGIVVMKVEPGSAAERAGLKGAEYTVTIDGQDIPVGGDVIIAVDDIEKPEVKQLIDLVFSKNAGDVVNLTVWRDGKILNIPVKLAVVEAQAAESEGPQSVGEDVHLGVTVEEMSSYPELIKQRFGLPNNGLIIVEVERGSAAQKAGLLASEYQVNYNDKVFSLGGDIILKADNQVVKSLSDLKSVLSSKNPGDSLRLVVLRGGIENVIVLEF